MQAQSLRIAKRIPRHVARSLGILLLGFVPVQARAATDALAWVPIDTRVVLSIDPQESARQPGVGVALGLDRLLDQLVSQQLPATQRQHLLVAYIREGELARPVAFTIGTSELGRAVERLRGAQLESVGGKVLYASRSSKDWTLVLVGPDCLLEGPRQTVRALLDHAARKLPSVADIPATRPQRRLLALEPEPATALSLLYFAPEGGTTVFAALQDLDRTLGAELGAAVAPYKSALGVLGNTHGGRVDVAQEGEELATTLRLVMPSEAAANLASITLQAGKDMARAASEAAVQAGSLSEADARVLSGALSTLRARSERDWVHVQVRIAEVMGAQGAR